MYQPGHPHAVNWCKLSSKLQAVLQHKARRIEGVALHPRRLPGTAPAGRGDRLAWQHLEAAGGAARPRQVDLEDFVGAWSRCFLRKNRGKNAGSGGKNDVNMMVEWCKMVINCVKTNCEEKTQKMWTKMNEHFIWVVFWVKDGGSMVSWWVMNIYEQRFVVFFHTANGQWPEKKCPKLYMIFVYNCLPISMW